MILSEKRLKVISQFYQKKTFSDSLNYLEIDYNTSTIRVTDWFLCLQATDTVPMDEEHFDWWVITNMQSRFLSDDIHDTIYIHISDIMRMEDVHSLKQEKYIDKKWDTKSFLYIYWTWKIIVVDNHKVWMWSLWFNIQDIIEKMSKENDNLFWIETATHVMYEDSKVKFLKILKTLSDWNWTFTIWKSLMETSWSFEWMEYLLSVKNNMKQE